MKKILVIEDEDSLRNDIVDILKFEGFEVYNAENGKLGIQLALKKLPDLILCDVMMPEVDGYGVLKELRANNSTKITPFVFITALAERENIRSGMELGADDYITKPFDREELLNAINSRLKKSNDVIEHSEKILSELKLNLIHTLPHELRTPLNGIIGFGQILMDNPDSLEPNIIEEYGKNIYNSGMRLYRLIQNYLLYAELELNKFNVAHEDELIDADYIFKSAAEKSARKNSRFHDLIVQTESSQVSLGAKELDKIVEEITDNAFKFSNSGSKVICNCFTNDKELIIEVKDTGRGISESDLKKIGAYMQFDRLHYEQQGSGLGLIISKKITELYGGDFRIESTLGLGTTVTIKFPK